MFVSDSVVNSGSFPDSGWKLYRDTCCQIKLINIYQRYCGLIDFLFSDLNVRWNSNCYVLIRVFGINGQLNFSQNVNLSLN